MTQVIGRIEHVQWACAHLVIVQEMLLSRIITLSDDKHSRGWCRTDDVIDGARKTLRRIPCHRVINMRARRDSRPNHAALRDAKPRRVRHDGLFEGHLRAVRERRNHRRVLAPLIGKEFLSVRIAIPVMKTFDVAAEHRLNTHTRDCSVEVHDDAGLVPIRVRQNYTRFVCVGFEDRSDCAV